MSEKIITINNKEYYTYATLEDADNYFAAAYGSEWEQISENQKQKLLITATRLIDRRDYQGEKVNSEQPLKFPRIICDEKTNDDVLITACCELAANIYSDGGIDKTMSNIKSVSLGDSSISFIESGKTESEDDLIIEKFLSEYLMGGVRVIL